MRHWQPIHHERWRGFVESLAASLRGERPAPLATAAVISLPVFVASVPAITPPDAVAVDHAIKTPAPAIVAAPVAIAETPFSPAVEEPAPRPSTARAFFSALGWIGGPAKFAAALTPAQVPSAHVAPSSVGETLPRFATAGRQSEAGPYFRTLPWDGRHAPGDTITSIRVTASREDDRLDPRTASLPADNLLLTGMLSAARTSDRAARHANRHALAGAYFHDLPWSR
jgi:hypothetical protein